MGFTFTVIIILLIIVVLIRNIRIVQQSHAVVIERLGTFSTVWHAGLHIKIPLIDRMVKNVTLKEQVLDTPPSDVISKDNVGISVDSVVYYQITDPKLYTYGIEQPVFALENLTATTLRNIIGELELDECLTSRDIINTKMRAILDEATDPWGIKVTRVELKNILPPQEIRSAMEKQMKAERERREAILRAEGEKKAAILTAEGEKEAAVLRAEAQKIQLVKEAEGHSESIRLHKQADADGIRMLSEAGMTTEQIVTLRSLDAFTAAADGKATKIIIPSELQGIAGLASGIVEASKN